MFDTHTHLFMNDFACDLNFVLQRAKANNINQIMLCATSLQDLNSMLDIQNKNSFMKIYVSLGLHPQYINNENIQTLNNFDKLLNNNIVAIGEIGLDKRFVDFDKQKQVLKQQINIAKQHNLPLIIHCVQAYSELLAIIKEEKFQNGGILHFYNSSYELAKEFMKLNFCFGVNLISLNEKSKKIRKFIEQMELQYLVLETDSPFMISGSNRNEPANLLIVAKQLADIKKINLNDIINITTYNACRALKI